MRFFLEKKINKKPLVNLQIHVTNQKLDYEIKIIKSML